jgi:hypothetical protein
MKWISAIWRYILSTPSVVSGGEALRGLVAVASIYPPPPLMASRGSHFPGLSLSGGEVHHQDPLRHKRELVSWQHMRLDRGSGLLAGEHTSPWCCLGLSVGLPSTGLHVLPPLTRVALLEGEAGVQPWHRCTRWNHRHGLSCQSVLHSWCGCDRSGQSPCAMPPGRGEAEAPLPARHHEELLGVFFYHGPPQGWCPATS